MTIGVVSLSEFHKNPFTICKEVGLTGRQPAKRYRKLCSGGFLPRSLAINDSAKWRPLNPAAFWLARRAVSLGTAARAGPLRKSGLTSEPRWPQMNCGFRSGSRTSYSRRNKPAGRGRLAALLLAPMRSIIGARNSYCPPSGITRANLDQTLPAVLGGQYPIRCSGLGDIPHW